MKRKKITAVILSLVMSMSLMMPSAEVLADEASDPSETQKTETVETKESKATEKQTPKETEKQETAESDETRITETAGSDEKEPAESKDNGDNPEESNETAVVEGKIPSQSASTPKKNAVTGTCGENLTWSYADGTLTISGSGKMSTYTNETNSTPAPWIDYRNSIISVVFSGTITSIGNYAFYKCTKLTSITIPNSVTSIDYAAFEGCTSLASVTILNGVTSIGNYAFYLCSSLTSITIPNSVTSIAGHAFHSCTSLTSITIPNGVTVIHFNAFDDCTSLTSITIPNSVTTIEWYAFRGCTSLTSITIPNSVKTIETAAFSGCSKLKNVYYYGAANDWKDITIGGSNEPLQNAYKKYIAAYSITVNSGMSDLAKAVEGTTVTVTANAASSGKVFDKWVVVSGKVTLKDETQKTTTFTMPAENVEVTATYKDVEYTIKVNNGSATPATAAVGTAITLTADAALSGKVFDKWIVDSGTVSLSNASSSTTTFTMPAENVEVTATYKDVEYTIKVNNGSSSPATASAGTVIVLTADAAPSGKAFDKWIVVSGTVKFTNSELSSVTTFTMPAGNVEISATYKTVPSGKFVVKVNSGFATPSISAPGLVVNVTANDAPDGTEFDKWEVVSGTVIFADASSATTSFVMPAENVEITAKYKSSLSVKGKTATVKYSKLKKKNQTLAVSKVLTFVDKGQGQLSYAKVSGNSKILINKTTGNITVKKKLKKKTYTVKVKVMASGNENCNPSEWKTVTFKIKVK